MFVEEKTQGEPAKVLDDASKLLLKAADLLEERGWCQKKAYKDGKACLVGAIHIAHLGGVPNSLNPWEPQSQAAHDRVRDALGRAPAFWNDDAGRTQAEVVSKLRAVALGL
jgi:hypothetical protein